MASQTKRTRRALERLIVLAIFAIPLMVNPMGVAWGGAVKDAAVWAAAGAAGWLLCAMWAARPEGMAVPGRLARPAAVWLVVTLASVAAARSRTVSAWAAMNLVPYVVLALAVGVAARRAPARRRLLAAWVGSAAVAAGISVGQAFIAGGAAGPFPAPAALGAFLAMALPLAIPLSVGRRAPAWLPAATALIVGGLAATRCGPAWAAAAAGTLVAFYSADRGRGERSLSWTALLVLQGAILLPIVYLRARAFALPVGALTAAGLAAWACRVPGLHRARRALAAGAALGVALLAARGGLKTVSPPGPSRDAAWTVATGMVAKRPWLGWGPDGYRTGAPSLARDAATSVDRPLAWPAPSAQSEFLGAAVEGGLAGLAAWGAVLLTLLSVLSDRARAERVGSGGAARWRRSLAASGAYGAGVAFVVQGCVSPRGPAAALGLAIVWGLAASLEPQSLRRVRAGAPLLRASGLAFAACAAVCAAAIVSADTCAGMAFRAAAAGRPAAALRWAGAAVSCNPAEPGYRAELGRQAQRLADAGEGIEAAQAAGTAREAYGQSAAAEPRNGLWLAGHALSLRGSDPAAALAEARAATRLSPLSSTSWWALARVERAAGDPVGEISALRASIECEPLQPAPIMRLAEVFQERGQPEIARTLRDEANRTYR